MSVSIGIVGLPNVGKSTLFQLVTKHEVNTANYPFATIDPNVGVVSVPDERVDMLAKLSNSKKKIAKKAPKRKPAKKKKVAKKKRK